MDTLFAVGCLDLVASELAWEVCLVTGLSCIMMLVKVIVQLYVPAVQLGYNVI